MRSDLSIREPGPVEVSRALYLLRNIKVRTDARLLVAVKPRPVERFVGVAAWWPEGGIGRFHLACQPGVDRSATAGLLLERLADDAGRSGMDSLHYADLLSEESEWLPVLTAQGFRHLRSERFFEVSYPEAWRRVMDLYEKHKPRVPPSWRTDSAQNHSAETVLSFISPHRLIPPEEVREFWRAESAGGFDLYYSNIIFDGGRPFGTFILRRSGPVIFIDVLVVEEKNRVLRSLAELCLFHHGVSRLPPDGPVRVLQFRSGEIEHRQTGNLALRMGGKELACRHVFAKDLGNSNV
jgi:hypothetical protein